MTPTLAHDLNGTVPRPAPSMVEEPARAEAPPSPGFARKAGALAWALLPPLLFSATLHTTDGSIEGIQGLARPAVLVSVVVWAMPLAVLALLSLWTQVRAGWLVAVVTALVTATVPGWFFFLLGSTATTPLAKLGSFLGITALCLATLTLAALPAAAVGWPERR